MAKKNVTMQDIATRLGVSKNAVYLALSGKRGVSEALRAKVTDMAEHLGYGAHGRGMPSCIILAVPEYLREDAYFYFDVFWAVETEAKKRGYLAAHTIITRDNEEASEIPRLPAGMKVVGIIAVGIFRQAYIHRLYGLGFPMISLDIHYHNVPIGCVSTCNISAGATATRYLIEKGYKDIGFIGPAYSAQSVYERFCGFRQAMETAGLPPRGEWCVIGEPNHLQFFDDAENLSPYIKETTSLPEAWFCAGDRIAVAAMNLMAARGIRVPEDVAIIGFDDIPLAEMVLPKLTTMRVDRKRMGRLAVEYLLRCAEYGEEMLNINLPCTLVERDSVLDSKSTRLLQK